jgi:3-oxoadipate enol-lactonase
MFDELARVADQKYHVFRPDFRGQGSSAPATTEVVEMDTLADDIEAFMDTLELTQVDAVVQSMGGDVILRLAARRPELFRTLVLLGTSARGEPADQRAFVEGFLSAASESGFVGEHLETLLAIMFGESTRHDPAKAAMVGYWRSRMQALPLALWPAMRGVVSRSSVVDSLPLIQVPSLVISGAEDRVRPGEWADEMAHGLARVKHVRLPRVGHSVILEEPQRVIFEIMRFLQNPLAETTTE